MGLVYLLFFSSLIAISRAAGRGNVQSTSDCNYCMSETCTPTIIPASDFSPRRDRLEISYEVLGWATAANTLIKILAQRSDLQRLQISEEYIRTGSTLIDDIEDDIAGDSLEPVVALTKPLPLFYAEELYGALYNKDFDALIEILCSLPSCAIRKISVLYRIVNGISLTKHIASVMRSPLKDFVHNLAMGDRDEHPVISPEQVKVDVKALISGGKEAILFVDHQAFTEILTKRSFAQLRATFEAYETKRKKQDLYYRSIEADINDLFSSDMAKAYLAILKNVDNQHEYFAKELESALSNFSIAKDGRKLIRIIRGRCEIDLEDIKKKYLALHRKSLASSIHRLADEEFEMSIFGILGE